MPVALKWMTGAHKLPIELACALAGAELGLSIPGGVVVLAERDQLPGLPSAARPLPGSNDYLCFGSVHQWPDDSIARMMGNDVAAAEHTWHQLCGTPGAAPGAAWDELAANADRHPGNIVYDGSRYWFIDHELALKPIAQVMKTFGVQASRLRIAEHRADRNQVADELARRRPNDHEMFSQPPRFLRAEHKIKMLADQVRNWNTGNAQVDATWPMTEVVLRGIALRLPGLALMLNHRLSVPDPTSLWNSSSPTPKP